MSHSIESISKEGKKRELLFNESILLLNKSEIIKFNFKYPWLNLPIAFEFIEDNTLKPFETKAELDPGNKYLTLKLNKWYSTTFAENIEPMELKISGRKLYFKFRIVANETQNFRSFNISIWGDL